MGMERQGQLQTAEHQWRQKLLCMLQNSIIHNCRQNGWTTINQYSTVLPLSVVREGADHVPSRNFQNRKGSSSDTNSLNTTAEIDHMCVMCILHDGSLPSLKKDWSTRPIAVQTNRHWFWWDSSDHTGTHNQQNSILQPPRCHATFYYCPPVVRVARPLTLVRAACSMNKLITFEKDADRAVCNPKRGSPGSETTPQGACTLGSTAPHWQCGPSVPQQ